MSILGRGFTFYEELLLPDGELVKGPPIHNKTPQEGVDFIASLLLGSGAPISSWYLFLFEANYVPTGSERASDLPGVIGECTAYSQASRPAFNGVYDGTSVIDNLADKGKFNFTANKTIYGAGIVSAGTKAGGGGLIISIARFPSPRVIAAGTEYSLGAAIPLLSTDL